MLTTLVRNISRTSRQSMPPAAAARAGDRALHAHTMHGAVIAPFAPIRLAADWAGMRAGYAVQRGEMAIWYHRGGPFSLWLSRTPAAPSPAGVHILTLQHAIYCLPPIARSWSNALPDQGRVRLMNRGANQYLGVTRAHSTLHNPFHHVEISSEIAYLWLTHAITSKRAKTRAMLALTLWGTSGASRSRLATPAAASW